MSRRTKEQLKLHFFFIILHSAKAQCGESFRKFCSIGNQVLTNYIDLKRLGDIFCID